jgi:hypothetical protein
MPDNENTPCFASDPKDDLKLSAENKNRLRSSRLARNKVNKMELSYMMPVITATKNLSMSKKNISLLNQCI